MANYARTLDVTASLSNAQTGTTQSYVTGASTVTGDTVTVTCTVSTGTYGYHVSTAVYGTPVNCTAAVTTNSGIRDTTSYGQPNPNAYHSGNNPKGVITVTPTSAAEGGSYTAYVVHNFFIANFEGEINAWMRWSGNHFGKITGSHASSAQFASGQIAFSAIQSVFGGSNPVSLSEYVEGGSYVPDNDDNDAVSNTTGESGGMSLSDYRNTTTVVPIFNSGTLSMVFRNDNLPGKGGSQVGRRGYNVGVHSYRAPAWTDLGSTTNRLVKISGTNYADFDGLVVMYLYGYYYLTIVMSGANNGSTPPANSTWSTLKLYNSSGVLQLTRARSGMTSSVGSAMYYSTKSRYWTIAANSTMYNLMTSSNGGYVTIE